ncbi:MAG: peptidylprolyl isomerase [Bacillota bacterium]
MRGNRVRLIILIVLLGAALALGACAKKAEVVAIVNGEEIRADVLEDKLDKFIKAAEAQGYNFEGADGEERKNDFRKQLLSDMIEFTLLAQGAKAEGISVDKKKVDEELAELKAAMGEEGYKNALKESFLTEKDVREMIEEQLLIEALFDHVTRDARVEDQKIKEYYETNKANLTTMKVRHILFEAREDEATDEERAEAKKQAEELIAKLNSGADFEELAKEYSQDPVSAVEGGLIDYYFTEDDIYLVTEFVQGAYELKVGEYSSKPVETMFGYHIIQAVDKKDTFDSVKDDIEQILLNQERNRLFDIYYGKLFEEAEITNNLIEAETKQN